jgi:hypothetical protein
MTGEEMKRPSSLTFAAILMFMVGAFNVVFAFSIFGEALWLQDYLVIMQSKVTLSGIIDLFIAAGCFISGYYILKGKPVGWYIALIFAVLNGIKWFFMIFWFPFMGIIAIGIDAVIIYSISKGGDYFDEYKRLGID